MMRRLPVRYAFTLQSKPGDVLIASHRELEATLSKSKQGNIWIADAHRDNGKRFVVRCRLVGCGTANRTQ
jgi:hypothetical protein